MRLLCLTLHVAGSIQHYEALRRILFIYAKLNRGICYVQGMNEILAPIYYIFASDPTPYYRGKPLIHVATRGIKRCALLTPPNHQPTNLVCLGLQRVPSKMHSSASPMS
jgi:hypothetical protein